MSFDREAHQGLEMRYQQIEKFTQALVNALRKFKQYFIGYQMLVWTDQPLANPTMRITKWIVKLYELDVGYESASRHMCYKLRDRDDVCKTINIPSIDNLHRQDIEHQWAW